jgi:hypothetical protein
MEPTSEIVALLREIRDDQRALIVLTKAVHERWDRERRQAQTQIDRAMAEYDARVARHDEATKLWTETVHRQRRAAEWFAALLVGSALCVGIAYAQGWFG